MVHHLLYRPLIALLVVGTLAASSCQKCQQCAQYCAYCYSASNNSIAYKICATSGEDHYKVDSLYTVFLSSGYTCNMLDNDKKVCDKSNALNTAVDYYVKQDYYCVPK